MPEQSARDLEFAFTSIGVHDSVFFRLWVGILGRGMAELLPLFLEPIDDSAILGSEGFVPLEPLRVNLVTSNHPVWEARELLNCLEERSESSLDFDIKEFTGRGRSPQARRRLVFNNIIINSFETGTSCHVDIPIFEDRCSSRRIEDKVIVDVVRTAALSACERGPRDSAPFTVWTSRKQPYTQADLLNLLAETTEYLVRERVKVHGGNGASVTREIVSILEPSLAAHLRGKRTTQMCFLQLPCRMEFTHLIYDLTQMALTRNGILSFEKLSAVLASPRYRAPQRQGGTHNTTAYSEEDLAILKLVAKADVSDQSYVMHDIHPTIIHRRVCRLVRAGALRWKAKPRGSQKDDFALQTRHKATNEAEEDEAFLRYRDFNRYRVADAIGAYEDLGYERVDHPMPKSASLFGLDEILLKVELADRFT